LRRVFGPWCGVATGVRPMTTGGACTPCARSGEQGGGQRLPPGVPADTTGQGRLQGGCGKRPSAGPGHNWPPATRPGKGATGTRAAWRARRSRQKKGGADRPQPRGAGSGWDSRAVSGCCSCAAAGGGRDRGQRQRRRSTGRGAAGPGGAAPGRRGSSPRARSPSLASRASRWGLGPRPVARARAARRVSAAGAPAGQGPCGGGQEWHCGGAVS
jgi:hypothetical protein